MGTEESLYAVTYNEDVGGTVGQKGVIFYSSDAKQWQPFSTPLTIDALLHFGNSDGIPMITSRGDRVLWGYFYADPDLVLWGHFNNPEVFLKIWYDVSGRLDVNYFHVSVPEIEVYSDYPDDGVYDQRGVAIMADRYIRHEFRQ